MSVESKSKTITVFGSSRPREGDADYEEARSLGRALASRGFAICSGGYAGVMEAVSRGAKEAGGRTIAVTARFFSNRANAWVDEERAMESWQERLFELIRLGDGFVACKGGTGTLVELAVVWEMLNKRIFSDKPFVTLGGFWTPVLNRVREVEMNHGSRWSEASGPLVRAAESVDEAAEIMAQFFSRIV